MLAVFSCTYLVLLLVIFMYVKDIVSKWFIFFISSYWFVSLIISTLNPFGLYEVSFRTYTYIFIDVLCFLMGYFAFSSARMNKRLFSSLPQINITKFYKNLKFKIVLLFCFSVLIYYFINQWRIIILQNGLGNLKLETFDLVFKGNHLMYNIYVCVISPMFHIILALASYLIIKGEDRKYIGIFCLYILLFGFIGGKRAYYLTFFFYLLVALFVSNSYLLKEKLVRYYFLKKGAFMLFIFAVVFGFMIFMTSLSGGIGGKQERFNEIGQDLLKQFVVYSVGPFRAFDIGLDNNYLDEAGGYQLGRATLGGGIDYYGTAILRRIGINVKSVRELTLNKLQDTPIMVGNDIGFNYAYTNAMYHYYDFGLFGVFLFPFLFGRFVRYVISQLYIKRTFSLLVLISLLFFACVQMLQFWYFIGLYPILFVCFLLYLSNKEYKYIVLKKMR